jgi:acyl carrier protein/GNAT superfamily N-acetyltransferase
MNEAAAALHAELAAALQSWGLALDEAGADASLIRSGRLDSVALFNLALWVEERIGAPVDPTSFDVVAEWDTPASIVAFVLRRRTAPAADAVPPSSDSGASKEKQQNDQPKPPAVSTRRTDLRVVRATEADIDRIAQLQTRLWSPDPAANRAFFRWKYLDNPFSAEPIVHLVLDERGEAIATRGFCMSEWEAAAGPGAPRERLRWYCVDDLVVLPGHESRGVFALLVEEGLTEMARVGAPLYLSLSALRVSRLQSLTTGSQSLGGLLPIGWRGSEARRAELFDRVLGRLPMLWRQSPAWRRRVGARAFAALDRMPQRSTSLGAIGVTREPDAPAMAALIDALPYDGRIRHRRDARYFDWRYRNPLHQHRFVFLRDGGKLLGYAVLERALSDFGNGVRVNFADWEAVSDEAAMLLMQHIADALRPFEVAIWSATLPPPRRTELARLGLAEIDADQSLRGLPAILLRAVNNHAPLAVAGREPTRLSNWDIRMCYTNAV